jgi:hypothetical protein
MAEGIRVRGHTSDLRGEPQDLYPEAPSEPVALMTLVALAPPVAAIPLIGRALDNGDGELTFGVLAVFVALAALANLRRTGIALTAVRADADSRRANVGGQPGPSGS